MRNPPKKDEASQGNVKRRGGALAVGAFVPSIARAAFEANGFPIASVLSDWPEIIGPEFAGITVPERLIWPRDRDVVEGDAVTRGARSAHRRTGATLVIRVEGPRALEVQHMATQFLDRINTYFGYRAIADMRLVQGPVVSKVTELAAPVRESAEKLIEISDAIEDEDLRNALARLGSKTGKHGA